MVSEHKFNSKLSPIRTSAVDLQHLRYAVAAADHGSFRRAAEVLLLQQSTLSRCIRQLEHSLGMTVFERSSGGCEQRRPVAIFSELLDQSWSRWIRW
jgi:predicted transcriptional regulator